MKNALMHLLNLLEDEFRAYPSLRIRPVSPSGTRRSPDLEQDYDPESNSIHLRSGVMVQAGKREYFFPLEWIADASRHEIDRQIEEIRDRLGAL